jgi:hypothetical protein
MGTFALFDYDNRLWRSDGTVGGTIPIEGSSFGGVDINFGDNQGPVVHGGRAYFSTNTTQVWTSDGTSAGTFEVALDPNPAVGLSGVLFMAAANSGVYFQATEFGVGSANVGSELYRVADVLPDQPVTVTTTGNGKVYSSPWGLNCGTDCTRRFVQGDSIFLTAVPNGSDTFLGWSGDCSGVTSSCNLTMDGPKTVIANFSGVGPVIPTLSINDVSLKEGKKGRTTIFTFTVTASAPAPGPITADWTTANGSAIAGSDYIAGADSILIDTGGTTATIQVTVRGDRKRERSETFTVVLSNPSGATIGDGSGTGTIRNDDRRRRR